MTTNEKRGRKCPESQLNLPESISGAAAAGLRSQLQKAESKYTEATVTAIEGLSCFHTASGFIYRKPWVFLTISFDNSDAFGCLNASV